MSKNPADSEDKTGSPESYDRFPPDLKILAQDISAQVPLKTGSSGVVYRGVWRNQSVAIKQFTVLSAGEQAQDFLEEAKIMWFIGSQSQYLMPLKALCLDPPYHYWLVTEFMTRGSLEDLLKSQQILPWSTRYQIALDIGYGLRDLHARGLLHRDLKSLNVLLTPTLRAKLTDFGLTKLKDKTLTQSGLFPKGSLLWMAPELLQPQRTKWTSAADVYSFGMVLWELAARKIPYQGHYPLGLMEWISTGHSEIIPDDCPPAFKSVIEACWQAPAKRPTAAKITQRLELLLTAAQEQEAKEQLVEDKEQTTVPLPLVLKEEYWALPDVTPVLAIQTATEQALQKNESFPNFRSHLWGSKKTDEKTSIKKTSEATLEDWQLFWAVAEACETVLCSPASTYIQQRQAMGDWIGQVHADHANLAALIEHGLTLSRYQQPQCVEVLVQVLHRLLNPQTPLPLWLRQLAKYGWEQLNRPLDNSKTQGQSRITSDYGLVLKKNIDHWREVAKKSFDAKDNQATTDTQLMELMATPPTQFSLKRLKPPQEEKKIEEKKSTDDNNQLLMAPKTPKDKLAALFHQRTKTHSSNSWFKQVADWLNTQLPPSPCVFNPFVMILTTGQYQLGIELVDGLYRHHPFFSHWAACFKRCVELFSEFACELDIRAVGYLNEQPDPFLPDGIGTHRELAQLTTLSPTHWRYQTTPMTRLDSSRRPLDLHGQLPPGDEKTRLRPHAIALNRQWQWHLLALTTSTPDEKSPAVQLMWPEAKEPRYLSPQLTQRLFVTDGKETGQLASHSRSLTPGQSDVWRITATDACQLLPEFTADTILAYLKINPHNLWRQWQHLNLQQRLIDYGNTGSLASLQYGQIIQGKFIAQGDRLPVWLSSPAGLTFCTEIESKGTSLSADIQVLDPAGQVRFAQCIAQLDPRCFTQAIFLSWLLVHEDDQLRNLGFEPFINTQGEGAFRVIPFDTDTSLDAPWIRLSNGSIQVKLKSLLFCFDAMQRPLDLSAVNDFLMLNLEDTLEAWLTPLAEVKISENRLPADSIEALYRRWQRLRQVLQLPWQSDDPMAPLFPRSGLELLTMVDPPLGQAYTEAFDAHTDPLKRFETVAQDYVRMNGMSVSASSGLLRGESVMQPKTVSISVRTRAETAGVSLSDALKRCIQYREENRQLERLLAYLIKQTKNTTPQGIAQLEAQISPLVGEIQALNQATQVQLEKRLHQKSVAEREATRLSQWEPLASSDLEVTIILPKTNASLLSAWQALYTQKARPGIRLEKTSTGAWQLAIHNGNYLIVNTFETTEQKEIDAWDLKPLYQALDSKPTPAMIQRACQQIYRAQLLAVQKVQRELTDSEAALKQLAQKRQEMLLRQKNQQVKTWYELPESNSQFLNGLLETTLRRTVMSRLPWGRLASGKGLQQLLRLLELGGLIELNLQDCTTVTDAQFTALVQNSPELTRINLSGCSQITSTSILRLAESALYLTRLSARALPKLTNLWQGLIWVAHSPLVFPQLTHADFSSCYYLRRIDLQAPKLQFLCLSDCSAPSYGLLDNTPDWTITTLMLKTLSLAGCTHLPQVKIQSENLENLNLSGIQSLTLALLQKLLTPKQWVGIHILQISEGSLEKNWEWLNRYLWLIPLAQQYMSLNQALNIQKIFSQPHTSASLAQVSHHQRWELQIGLALLCRKQQHDLLNQCFSLINRSDAQQHIATIEAIISCGYCSNMADDIISTQLASALTEKMFNRLSTLLEDHYGSVQTTANTISKIVSIQPNLAEKAFDKLTPLLKDSDWDVCNSTADDIGNIILAQPALAEKAFSLLSPLLKDSNLYVRSSAAKAIGHIASIQPNLAEDAILLLSPLLEDTWQVRGNAIKAMGRIASTQPNLAKKVFNQLGLLSKALNSYTRRSIAEAIGNIACAQPGLVEDAIFLLSPLLKDPNSYVRSSAAEAIGNIAPTQPDLAEKAFNLLLHSFKHIDRSLIFRDQSRFDSESISIATAIGRIASIQPVLAEEAFKLLSHHVDLYEYEITKTIGYIVSAKPTLAEKAFNLISPFLKDNDSAYRLSPVIEAIGHIASAQPALAEKAFNLLSPFFDKAFHYKISRSLGEAIQKIALSQHTVIYPLLDRLSPLIKKEWISSDQFFLITPLFIGVNQYYHLRWNSLDDYIQHFLEKCAVTASLHEQPSPSSTEHSLSLKLPEPSQSPPMTALITLGDDHSLSKHGHERRYWYSITDLYLLSAMIREKQLNYLLSSDSKDEYKSPGGEHASSYRENQTGIFIADPYVQVGEYRFEQFLKEDMAIITGTHELENRRNSWRAMPRWLFFTWWRHGHWQLIGLEINYKTADYLLWWDDPFGKGRFTESVYNDLASALHNTVQALLKTHQSLQQSTETNSKLVLKSNLHIKALDQQGRGYNGYDCGPIAMQNLQDYVEHISQGQSLTTFEEKQLTVPAASSFHSETRLITIRTQHYQYASGQTSTVSLSSDSTRLTIQKTALSQAQGKQKALCLDEEKTDIPNELNLTLSALPAIELGNLFAFIDHQRLLTTDRSLEVPYTPEELHFAYTYTTSTEQSSTKALSQLFTASTPQSSSSTVSSSSSTSSTTSVPMPHSSFF